MANKLTIQHKRSSVAGNQPTAAQIAVGELAINFADQKLYTKTGTGTIIPLMGSTTDVRIQTNANAPTTRADASALQDGDIWYDTTANKLKVREAGAWVEVDTKEDPRVQTNANAPTTRADGNALADGDLWYDTTAKKLKVRESGAWVLVDTADQFDWQSGATGGAPTKTTKADGTTAVAEGDLFWDTTGNSLYAYDSGTSTWVLVGSRWTVETGGISRSDRIKVGSAGAPLADVHVDGTAAHNVVAISANTMDLNLGQMFIRTAAAGLWSITGTPTGLGCTIVLHLINGGAVAQTWPTSVKWPGGLAPTLTAAGTDVLVFVTHDGGTTWRGNIFGRDVK